MKLACPTLGHLSGWDQRCWLPFFILRTVQSSTCKQFPKAKVATGHQSSWSWALWTVPPKLPTLIPGGMNPRCSSQEQDFPAGTPVQRKQPEPRPFPPWVPSLPQHQVWLLHSHPWVKALPRGDSTKRGAGGVPWSARARLGVAGGGCVGQGGTYLRLQLALGEGHHLLVGHLREEGSVLVQPQALQPGGDVCSTKGSR